MKIDMHCHVSEGSPDSNVKIEEYIEILISKGFDGMLVTDHNTYNGYRHWKNHVKGKKYEDFVVLKGVEYDTLDAGHILVIMPEGVKMRLLELRGMPVQMLIDFVHRNGGVLGPAHPCGEKYMSYTNTRCFFKAPEVIKRFDFIEVYNACEPVISNEGAAKLAEKYRKLGLGGSDAHRAECVGMGYAEFEEDIRTELDLIEAIHNQAPTRCAGQIYNKTAKDKLGKARNLLAYSFWVYNKSGALVRKHRRNLKETIENPMDPIDPIEIDYLQKKQKGIKLQKKKE
ncbi:MAG: PHP domain-containing protein [Eubacteriales bacterium]